MSKQILIAKGLTELFLNSSVANRHGLVSGATGTGKTVTLKVMAEGFSRIGVPVFLADVKGDLAGFCKPGTESPVLKDRTAKIGAPLPTFECFPTVFWDIFGKSGHPVRMTISDLGPHLLSRLFNLNEIQSGVLSIVFKAADDNGMLLLDLKDLRSMVQFTGENARELSNKYGNISQASIGAIQRAVLAFSEAGGENLFGEPALNIQDLMQTDSQGRGVINVLTADRLIQTPQTYSTFLLWLLAELFENLGEVGDADKPRFVLFFDEAHLLFDEAPKALLAKIEQVVRLIRSKGVGVYFISQSPLDIAPDVLAQLGNRVQHALRAFTPRDQKGVRAAAETFRTRGDFDVERAITELGIGEALVSLLNADGTPGYVERAFVVPPASRMGSITSDERNEIIAGSPMKGIYEKVIDRESAYEMLNKRSRAAEDEEDEREESRPKEKTVAEKTRRQGPIEAFIVSTARSVGSYVGRELMRGVLGTLMGGRRR